MKTDRIWRSIKCFVTALFFTLAFAAPALATPSAVRIAFIDVLSGPFGAGGQWALAQFRSDASRINGEGGLNGHKVDIAAFDNKGSPAVTLVMLQRALDSGIRYVTQGGGSSVAAALITAINNHNKRDPEDTVLYLNYAALDPVFTNADCSFWHFRFNADTDTQTEAVVNWIKTNKKIERVFLLNQDYSYGQSIAKELIEGLKNNRPDIKIVGNVFVPPGKVNDFTPYIVQVKAAHADLLVTSNWGDDLVLLVKAADQGGLKIPFMTYNANTPGFIKAVGGGGVGRVFLVSANPYDYSKRAALAERDRALFKATGWNYQNIRITDELDLLKAASDKAGSVNPTKVAFALEGIKYDSPVGEVVMRATDHQIQQPLFISVLAKDVKYGMEGTDIGFREVVGFNASQMQQPTSCQMKRPSRG